VPATAPTTELLAGVRDIVAVHSAKGGVGKSTTAANFACAYARMGMSVGLLDADVHGPSIAHMFGSSAAPETLPGRQKVRPLERHGVRYLSLANVAPEGAPIIWRGPMVASALGQLLEVAEWGALDLLLVDMPPGTGDAVLGIGQAVRLSGVVVVTTPQALSVSDTRRGIRAFGQLRVPILGLVENMAAFMCDCGERAAIFGEGGGAETAESLGIPFLGRIPLEPAVVETGDAGRPIADADPGSPAALAFESAARAALAQLALHGRAGGGFDLIWERRAGGALLREPPERPRPVPAATDRATPLAVWQASDDVLGIRWAGGETTFHRARELRLACPCAACTDEWTREKLPSLERVPPDVRPVAIRSVGRYALQPEWSDGHRTGIFTWGELRRGAGAVDV
jgi:ATP-binding protein involved in chromosome partitioning